MQVFLPESDFLRSAQALDGTRLRNQVNECLVIAASALQLRRVEEQYVRIPRGERVPWGNHPAVKMWVGYVRALCHYGLTCMAENLRRTDPSSSVAGDLPLTLPINIRLQDPIRHARFMRLFEWARLVEDPSSDFRVFVLPMFVGNEDFHESHRSNLIRKNPTHYRPLWPNVPDNLPYIWPSRRTENA